MDDFGVSPSGEEEYYWNGTAIKPVGQGYDVSRDNHVIETKVSSDRAGQLAGVEPAEFRKWVGTARQLQLEGISTVGRKLPLNERYLEFRLGGSAAAGGYGLIYVPEGHKASFGPPDFHKLEQIDAHWFYFEDR